MVEIREVIRLSEEIHKSGKKINPSIPSDDEHERSGMSVYSGYIGKTIKRKDGFIGKVFDIASDQNGTHLKVHVVGGKDKGKDTTIDLSFVLKNRSVYTIVE